LLLSDSRGETGAGVIRSFYLLLLLLLSYHPELASRRYILSFQYPLLGIPLGLPRWLERSKLFGQCRQFIIIDYMFASPCFGLKRPELFGQSRYFIIVNYVFLSILLLFLHLVEEGPELLREGRELIIVYDALLFASLEVLKGLDLVLRQILSVLLAKCTKFIIIKSIIILGFLLFDRTLRSKFDPTHSRPGPLHLTYQGKGFAPGNCVLPSHRLLLIGLFLIKSSR